MTLVVGVDFGTEICVLADTRVSYGQKPGAPPPQDRLKKLAFISLPHGTAILGFSGSIPEVQRIMRWVKRRARTLPSSGSLLNDLKVLMEEPVGPREPLSFMLCGFEPTGQPRILVFDLLKNGKMRFHQERILDVPGCAIAIIGSGNRFREYIHKTILRPVGDPKKYKNFEAFSRVRIMMAESIISSWFQEQGAKDVGGPFMVCRLRPDSSLDERYMVPSGEDSAGVKVTNDAEKTVLHCPSTGKQYNLFSILAYQDADFHAHEDAHAREGLSRSD
jgi:hypothetical protein